MVIFESITVITFIENLVKVHCSAKSRFSEIYTQLVSMSMVIFECITVITLEIK